MFSTSELATVIMDNVALSEELSGDGSLTVPYMLERLGAVDGEEIMAFVTRFSRASYDDDRKHAEVVELLAVSFIRGLIAGLTLNRNADAD